MTSNWIETFNRLNPVAQEQYKRYSTYRDKNMWSEVPTGQGGDSADIDTKQWKADSGPNAFYLSPAVYNQYDELYKQEQTWKKEQQETTAKTTEQQQQTGVRQELPTRTTTPTVAPPPPPPPANFQYTPTTPVVHPTRPTGSPPPAPPSAVYTPQSVSVPPSVYAPQSAVPSNVSYAPLMSVSGADITSQVNSLLAQLAGLLSASNKQNPPV